MHCLHYQFGAISVSQSYLSEFTIPDQSVVRHRRSLTIKNLLHFRQRPVKQSSRLIY
jgi:hypothetical protein